MPEITVLMNSYNRREYLERVLFAYARQSFRDFEVIVADDGSDDGTAELVEQLRRELPFPVAYATHERQGHRRARTLNMGIRLGTAPYVLFTDCDSLPRADLLAVHIAKREPRRLLVGGYLRLSQEFSSSVEVDKARRGEYERALTPRALWRLRREHARIAINMALRRNYRPHNMGLNYSLWREDLLAVNGYDENFRGWGKADGDVRDRLRAIGVRPKSAWAEAIIFHLWHPPHPTKFQFVDGRRTRNALYARRPVRQPRCLNGLEKLPGWEEDTRAQEALLAGARSELRSPRIL
jgi:glycosyltransferase involved in cell wall biosynthesis